MYEGTALRFMHLQVSVLTISDARYIVRDTASYISSQFPSERYPRRKSVINSYCTCTYPAFPFMMRFFLLLLSTATSVIGMAKPSQDIKPSVSRVLPDSNSDVSISTCGAEDRLDSSIDLDKTGLLTRSNQFISRNWFTDRWNQVREWWNEDDDESTDHLDYFQGRGVAKVPECAKTGRSIGTENAQGIRTNGLFVVKALSN